MPRPSGDVREAEPDDLVGRHAEDGFARLEEDVAGGGRTRPEMARSVVDLPAPLHADERDDLPRVRRLRLTPCRAWMAP
jgi:hypothetical protein